MVAQQNNFLITIVNETLITFIQKNQSEYSGFFGNEIEILQLIYRDYKYEHHAEEKEYRYLHHQEQL